MIYSILNELPKKVNYDNHQFEGNIARRSMVRAGIIHVVNS